MPTRIDRIARELARAAPRARASGARPGARAARHAARAPPPPLPAEMPPRHRPPALIRAWLAKVKLPGNLRLQVDIDPYSFL